MTQPNTDYIVLSSTDEQITLKVLPAPQVVVTVEPVTTKVVTLNIGPKGDDGASGFTQEQGLFLFWDINHPSFFLNYVYSSGVLTDIDMYTNSGMGTHLMNKHFSYTGSVLTQIVVTRISDSHTETKTFNYTSGVLVSQNVVQA